MKPPLKLSPAEGEDDGEQWDEFELLLAQVHGHDGQLEEVEQEERRRVGHVVLVHRHRLLGRHLVLLRQQGAHRTVAQPTEAEDQPT